MRKAFFILTFLVLFVTVGLSQTSIPVTATLKSESSDKIKLSVSYLNTEFQANPLESLEYLKGISIDADARIFSRDGFRLGGVFNYQKVYDQTVIEDYMPMPGPLPTAVMEFDIQRNVNTYAFGVQLSKRLGPVEPFGAFLLGFRRPHSDLDRQVVRKYRVGLDVPFHKESNFFVRPFFVEFEVQGGFNGARTQKYGAGAGFRF